MSTRYQIATMFPYDMILGLDFLTELGFILDFAIKTIKLWDSKVEMLPKGIVTDPEKMALLYELSQDSSVLKQAESRQNRILEEDYSKIELKPHVDSLSHLDSKQKKELLQILRQYPTLFGGGLGKLRIDTIRSELKEDAEPYHAKPFPVLKAFQETTRKEVKRFIKLGIWERVADSS